MPTINKLPKRYYPKRDKTRLIYQYVYNTSQWRALRLWQLKQQPLCQLCMQHNIVREATEVHHIVPISTGETVVQIRALGFDSNNLMSLCEDCHRDLHANAHRKAQ